MWIFLWALLAGCSSGDSPAPAPRVHWVAAAKVIRAPVGEGTLVTGMLEARRRVRVLSQEAGRIAEIPFWEGDRVQSGEVVVRMDDRLLRAELDKAIALRRQAELDVKRLEGLAARQLAAEEAIAQARTALAVARAEEAMLRIRLEDMTFRAPFDAIVSERLAEPGDGVAAHTHLMTLFDPRSLTLRVKLPEGLLARVRTGQEVSVQVDALGKKLRGIVVRLFPVIDGAGQGMAELALDPLPPEARPGQFCRVRFPAERALSVPFSALQRDERGSYVFLLEGDEVRRVAVRTGPRFGTRVAILEGLEEGQQVVVKGLFGLREGMKVKMADG